MHQSINNLNIIKTQILEVIKKSNMENKLPTIIAISKTFPIEKIQPLIEFGHIHFGENKVQEATLKWSNIKSQNNDIKLHLVGKLQTNKTKQAIKLFDYIHSLDSIKLAKEISKEQKKVNKKPKIFIQINIGNEQQKSGISKYEVTDFYNSCKKLVLLGYNLCLKLLLNAGIYAPLKFNLQASLKLFDRNKLNDLFLQYLLRLIISSILVFLL